MLELIIGTKSNPISIDCLIDCLDKAPLDGTLYIGYPILSTQEEKTFIDALLTSRQHGVVVFDLLSTAPSADQYDSWLSLVEEKQNNLYLSVFNRLTAYKELRAKRDLAVPLTVLTFLPSEPTTQIHGDRNESPLLTWPTNLYQTLSKLKPTQEQYLRPLNAAIQRMSTLKPVNKRNSVKRPGSKGTILKEIEKQTANLDLWQKQAAIEFPNGPQRIRGLAGSGKTIVLALKAAYLHAANPNWNIVLTFQTRSLYEQFIRLVQRFFSEHSNEEPDLKNLKIMHAWGSNKKPGVYSEIAAACGVSAQDFSYGKVKYANKAFEGVCNELLNVIQERGIEPIYDAILIDEAQDFPTSFFQLAYAAVKEPKRIVWAYDELQNLGDYTMAPPEQIFGSDKNGNPRVQLRNERQQPKQDLVLPVCYRNTPWSLVTAHALGFGIYRKDRLVQMFDDPDLWAKIGYEIVNGSLSQGQQVTLARSTDASPGYFQSLLTPDDSVQSYVFESEEAQAKWVAENIKLNIDEDELEIDDILIILPEALTVTNKAALVMSALKAQGLDSHIAGVTTSRDVLFSENSIAITGIYRAKGNEAPMVYILNSQHCYKGLELIKKRNTLFTAITRSRGWVRICGYGEDMDSLKNEITQVFTNNFKLHFTFPNEKELQTMRTIHRDMSRDEKDRVQKSVNSLEDTLVDTLQLLETGELAPENIPIDLFEKVKKFIDKGKRKPDA